MGMRGAWSPAVDTHDEYTPGGQAAFQWWRLLVYQALPSSHVCWWGPPKGCWEAELGFSKGAGIP